VYVKASSRKTKDGQVIRYLQLAHNEWDAQAGVSRTKILHSFGREDEIDREGVKRLVAALSRLLDPAGALAATSAGELTLTSSRPVGGTYVLDQLWRRLGLDAVIRGQLAAASWIRGSSGCCSRWSPTGPWPPHRSSPQPAGSRTMCTSTAWMRSMSSRATGRWTTC
jgi:hypothetical protein